MWTQKRFAQLITQYLTEPEFAKKVTDLKAKALGKKRMTGEEHMIVNTKAEWLLVELDDGETFVVRITQTKKGRRDSA